MPKRAVVSEGQRRVRVKWITGAVMLLSGGLGLGAAFQALQESLVLPWWAWASFGVLLLSITYNVIQEIDRRAMLKRLAASPFEQKAAEELRGAIGDFLAGQGYDKAAVFLELRLRDAARRLSRHTAIKSEAKELENRIDVLSNDPDASVVRQEAERSARLLLVALTDLLDW